MIGKNKQMLFGRCQYGNSSDTSNADGNNEPVPICQIYFKPGQTFAEYWHRYIKNHVPQQLRSYNKGEKNINLLIWQALNLLMLLMGTIMLQMMIHGQLPI